jgi:hypothetical protein
LMGWDVMDAEEAEMCVWRGKGVDSTISRRAYVGSTWLWMRQEGRVILSI